MIELITGLPGNGKTLHTISRIKAKAEKENRPVFYNGIPEVKIPGWELLDDPREWAKCPPRSIILLDEGQKTFRNRSMGSVPPEYVQQLETHRHLGVDLHIITQHPSLIDPAVRRLAGAHYHVVRIWGSEVATVHYWPSVKDNCDKSRGDSEKTKWAFDKSVYSLYKSAEVHTVKRSIPGRVKLLFGLLVLFAICLWYVAGFIMKKTAPASPAVASAPSSLQSAGFVSPNANKAQTLAAAKFDPVADAMDFARRETPRVVGLPQTAPKYDKLTEPTRVPIPAMCVQIGDVQKRGELKCKCYTQQGTPMDLGFNQCVQIAHNGFFLDFDPEAKRAEQTRADVGQAVLKDLPESHKPDDRERDRSSQVMVIPELPDPPVRQVRTGGGSILGKG
jgi:hypothetical protein